MCIVQGARGTLPGPRLGRPTSAPLCCTMGHAACDNAAPQITARDRLYCTAVHGGRSCGRERSPSDPLVFFKHFPTQNVAPIKLKFLKSSSSNIGEWKRECKRVEWSGPSALGYVRIYLPSRVEKAQTFVGSMGEA